MSVLSLSGAPKVTLRHHRLTLRFFTATVTLGAALVVVLAVLASGSAEAEPETTRFGKGVLDYLLLAAQTPMNVLPLLVGAFVAGPLVARELESGTYTWLWTQSVTPVRWLATKVVIATVVTTVGSGVTAAALRLALENAATPRFTLLTEGTYGMVGPVAVGYSLLGVGLGVPIGLLMRRTVPAMVVTAVAVGAVNLVFFTGLRDTLWPVETMVSKSDIRGSGPHHVVESGLMSATGTRVPESVCLAAGQSTEECAAAHDAVSFYADVHPESHFWPMQLIETGILVTVAAVAVAVAFRVLNKRHNGAT
ncbi:ABC transporter permease [Streptomyces sp. CA-294286]|uniref:ABC transporter permease n=1 Tax=Streptomyces sp. CA-294286 TaxID=3240070 RepID=UPI003D8F7601